MPVFYYYHMVLALSKYLFNYQKELQKELIQKIKDNPELQRKIDNFIHKINKDGMK